MCCKFHSFASTRINSKTVLHSVPLNPIHTAPIIGFWKDGRVQWENSFIRNHADGLNLYLSLREGWSELTPTLSEAEHDISIALGISSAVQDHMETLGLGNVLLYSREYSLRSQVVQDMKVQVQAHFSGRVHPAMVEDAIWNIWTFCET